MKNMEIYKTLESLGFFEWLYDTHDLRDTDMKPEYLDRLSLDDIHRTVANSMAFRWFREIHSIFPNVSYEGKFMNTFEILNIKGDDYNSGERFSYYNTYEEAELACLNKLIEIVKQKQ
jgi:hypothetical protein